MRTWLLKSSLLALLCVPSAEAGEQRVEVLRDPWGIPHIFADTDAGAFRGLGSDCLASWWHLGQFFASDGTRDLIAGRNEAAGQKPDRAARGQPPGRGEERPGERPVAPADLKPMPPDDGPAVVKRTDVPGEWIERVGRYAREHIVSSGGGDGAAGPKFSHAWVVGGQRTTTGSSVLVSDPQTPVRNPSLFYEFHLQGKTFNARGIGVPGSPIILIGFTDQVAWGVTALGADQADLFQLDTDPARPDH